MGIGKKCVRAMAMLLVAGLLPWPGAAAQEPALDFADWLWLPAPQAYTPASPGSSPAGRRILLDNQANRHIITGLAGHRFRVRVETAQGNFVEERVYQEGWLCHALSADGSLTALHYDPSPKDWTRLVLTTGSPAHTRIEVYDRQGHCQSAWAEHSRTPAGPLAHQETIDLDVNQFRWMRPLP